ncbi:DNA polymerase Y family protein [Yoonia sp. R2331]|uniref:Y-family DNA polymerase n=1 Tax=Yoonia sp. R2331 TaxID=3237238 RepID=UPI0034E468E2
MDQLPVLAFPTPPAAKDPVQAPPDDLAHALKALREAETWQPHTPAPDPAPPQTDSFGTVGAPCWRAGPRATDQGAGRAGVVADAVAPTGLDTDRDPLTRRITSIHLPDFAMERWLRWAAARNEAPPDDLPVILATEGPHGPIVHACTRAACLAGIHVGARVVDMRALCPEAQVAYADTGGDAAALARLALWARRWCPWTATDGADGLVLDTTGSDHLWGGEAAMLREIEEKLSLIGFSANLACAPTHGAAWALARLGRVRQVVTADRLAQDIAQLPARALRLDADTQLLLKRLGLKSVGDLAAVPRLSLARRFNRAALPQNPLLRLDQMMGRLAEPVNAPEDPPRFAVQARLAEPVQDPTPHLPALCAELCDGLDAAGFGARRVTVTVFRTDGEVRDITVTTAHATRDADHIQRLFDDKLDRIDPGFGFDLITLGAAQIEALSAQQTRLDGQADNGAELARLVDRLSARLGPGTVRCPSPVASHVPERAEDWRPALAGPPRPPQPLPDRPLRLFDHPEEVRVLYAVPEGPPAQFVWRKQTHRAVRFAGPERIAPEWWRDMPGTRLRDYYRIEDDRGRRIWLYRDGVLDDGRGETPRWFIHGVFA